MDRLFERDLHLAAGLPAAHDLDAFCAAGMTFVEMVGVAESDGLAVAPPSTGRAIVAYMMQHARRM